MNTIDTPAGGLSRIGLIELPDLAETLTLAGLHVVTGPDFRSAAGAIKNAFSTSGVFPIVTADVDAAGLRAWLERIQEVTAQAGMEVAVAVIRNGARPVIESTRVRSIEAPATVNGILAAVKLPALPGAAGLAAYPAQVATVPAPVVFPEPEADPFGLSVAAAVPVAVQQPQVPAAPEPAVFTSPEDDFLSDSTALEDTAPAAGGWGFRPAAPPVDAWAAPAPAPEPAPAPAAPVQPVAPADDFSWGAPAAPVQQAPVQAAPAPVWNAPAPAATDSFDWDAPAPQPAPAPVQQAPAPAAYQPAPAAGGFDWDAPAPAPQAPVQAAPVRYEHAPQTQAMPDSWTAHAQAQATAPDASGVFDDLEASKVAGTGRSAAGLASMIICWSGKGGVGKSTTSLQLAQLASDAGLRVILIDGNVGQGDLRTYLRLHRSDLPTIYSAAVGDVRGSVIGPDQINAARADNLGQIRFGFVSAPPEDLEDSDIVDNDVYKAVIDYARRNADLVILDTQIVEAFDRTGVVKGLILPALVQDAWALGVADMNNVGVNNLNSRLRLFLNEGVPADRLMVALNKVPEEQADDAARAAVHMRGKATYLGAGLMDDSIRNDMNAGRVTTASPTLRAALSAGLHRVTGNDAFLETARTAPAAEAPRRTGFFGRLFGGKKVA